MKTAISAQDYNTIHDSVCKKKKKLKIAYIAKAPSVKCQSQWQIFTL